MKKAVPLSALLFVFLFSFTQSSKHIREVFHESVKSESKLQSLIASKDYPNTDVTNAYKGLAKCTSADFATWPTTKWTYFKEGKALIEAAVKASPANPEIAYVRFMVQANAPALVDYSDEIEHDISVFQNNIQKYNVSDTWKQKFIKQMAASVNLTAAQKTRIKNTPIN